MTEPLSPPWVSLQGWRNWRLRRRITAECRRELASGHELHGRVKTAVARCSACDDVVFRLRGDAGFAQVHLTWSRREEPPPWPRTVVLPSFLALESAMDHHEHDATLPEEQADSEQAEPGKDGLTGLPTHRRLLADWTAEHAVVVLVDVDGLIWLNDYEGFAAGDNALISVGGVVGRAAERAGGAAYRVGGEEFLISAEGLELADGVTLANQIVAEVRALQIPYQRTDRPSRKLVEVNAAIVQISQPALLAGIGEHGLGGELRENVEEAIYAEKQRSGLEAGVVASL